MSTKEELHRKIDILEKEVERLRALIDTVAVPALERLYSKNPGENANGRQDE